ncbi:MAG: DUF2341 domain-containing protein [Candidatus Omnitrophota bacterium]
MTRDERRETISCGMIVLRSPSFVITVLLFCSCFSLNIAHASTSSAEHSTLIAPLLWRAGGGDNDSFKKALLSKASLAEDGSVVSSGSGSVCELETPYATENPVNRVSATWTFTGQVTLEVNATGNPQDYVRVINGVPLQLKEEAAGSRISWRATLAPQSTLSRVRIVFSGSSGVTGSFGNELLSGFKARKEIFLNGAVTGDLFQYQIPVKVGESKKSTDTCDLKLDGGILSEFKDVRFTLADGETVLPHFLESVSGAAPDRVATFWIKVPEIPKDGLFLYMYFNRPNAEDISNGEKVFDLFEDFSGATLDPEKWKLVLGDKTGKAYTADSLLVLEKAKLTTAHYEFSNGLLEYQARVSAGGAVAGILRQTAEGNNALVAYASTLAGSEHAVAKGGDVQINDPKPVTPGVFYVYRVHCDNKGDWVFQRYAENGEGEVQAEVKYSAGAGEASPVGLSSSNQDHLVECSWIRTRRDVTPAPKIDREKTASGILEPVDLPEFYHVVTAPDGSLVAAKNTTDGFYISARISPGFKVRILKPSWETGPADEESINLGIATKAGGEFYTGWESGKTRYVSRKEFGQGGELRWRAEIPGNKEVSAHQSAQASELQKTGLKRFSLKFYPGTIRVVLPNGGEKITSGAKYSIFWNAEGYDADYPMGIAYSDAGGKDFTAIVTTANGFGDYSWNVPEGLFGEILIKVSDGVSPDDVFDISDRPFSIVRGKALTEQDTEQAAAAAGSGAAGMAENNTSGQARKKLTLYELLIKVSDATAQNVSGNSPVDEGDIVMIKPAGYLWGKEERQKFLIVQARLTEKEAADLVKPKEVVTVDKSGKTKIKIVSKRRYKLNLLKADMLGKKEDALKGRLKTKPEVKREMVEEKV